jgi:CheY-like chemotaxis protein
MSFEMVFGETRQKHWYDERRGTTSREMTTRSPFIFIADDDDLDASLTVRAIKRVFPDALIEVVHDGAAAIVGLGQAICEGRIPDLAILDYKMPKCGCPEIMEGLADSHLVKDTPFVLFSSSVRPEDVSACLSIGVREFVEKPTDPERYGEVVADLCRRYVMSAAV